MTLPPPPLGPDESTANRMLADSPLPALSLDLTSGQVVCANAAAAALLGRTTEALIGMAWRGLCEVDETREVTRLVQRLRDVGTGRLPMVVQRGDGHPLAICARALTPPSAQRSTLVLLLESDEDELVRKQASLARTAEQYARAAEVGRVAAWEIWPEEGKVIFDGNLARLLGYEAGELGESLADWVDTVPEAARGAVAAQLQDIAEGRIDRYDVEHPVRRKDGSIGWVRVQGERVSARGEKPVRVAGASVDITDFKQRERDLEMARFAIDQSADAIFWITGDGRVVRANAQAARSLGLTPEALAGKFIGDFDPTVAAEGWTALDRRIGSRHSAVFQSRHRRADGHVFPVEVTSTSVVVDGQSFGFCIARDITERVRAEEELRRLNTELAQRIRDRTAELDRQSGRTAMILRTTIDGFCAIDAKGLLVDCNDAFCDMLGYARDEVLGENIERFDAHGTPGFVDERRRHVHRAGKERFDTRHRHRDGHLIDVEVSANVDTSVPSPIIYCFVRDISRRRRTQDDLRRARDEAERANLAKSEFLSRMSHELRTPLNAVLGFGQLLEIGSPRPDQKTQVREILSAGRHLLTLIDEVLDLSRVESGHLSISPEPVALLPLLGECLTLIGAQARAAGIVLDDVPAACAVHLLADRTRLKQVLLNLLSNAVKYNRPQGRVSVSCRRVEAADAGGRAMWRLEVGDEGLGLDPSQQSRLFRPFERLDADERRIQGTGIGLALSKRLTELMGGQIGVDSQRGAGSRFWVSLPVATAHDEMPPPPSGPTLPSAPRDDLREVLCIEDNPANLRLVEGIFAYRNDLRLISAMSPGLGLELARSHRPALILLDINLPDMDGYAVLRCLQEDAATRDIPVVAVTANAMPADVARARAAGFVAHLCKPLDLVALMRRVDELLGAPPKD